MSLPNNMVPSSSINQQPSSTQPQVPPQPPQNPSRDIEAAKRNYRQALSELTFNSKPIITNLTIMAQENLHAAGAMVREIEQQIKHNAPGQKLPVLYLIDSICKNVGGVYIDHFARNIVSTFLDAYTLTDPQTRRSFERLLQTWKNGLPNGQPVFARHLIESIERPVNYMRERQGAHPTQQPRSQPKPPVQQQPQPQPQQQQRLSPPTSHPATASPQRSQPIHVNPNFVPVSASRDPRARPENQQRQRPAVSASSQDSAATPANGAQGPQQLSNLFSQIQSILPGLPAPQAATFQHQIDQILGAPAAPHVHRLSHAPTFSAPLSAASQPPQLAATAPMPAHASNRSSMPPASSSFASMVTSAPEPAPAINTTELLQGLTSLGILNSTAANAPSTSANTLGEQRPSAAQHADTGVRLESKDLQIARPGAVEVLYSGLPLQCKQCGFRYPKTQEGQSKMDAHLDSHFRQNRRLKERVKRGLSRSWFVTEDEWVSGAGGELASHQAPTFLNDTSSSGQQAIGSPSAATGVEAIGPESRMVVMPDEDNRKPCPICGERFVDFWNDDEEEWMYKNAVLDNDTIYHATCHTDAVRSGTLMPGRDSTDDPMVMDSQGTKRKLEPHEDVKFDTKIPRTDSAL